LYQKRIPVFIATLLVTAASTTTLCGLTRPAADTPEHPVIIIDTYEPAPIIPNPPTEAPAPIPYEPEQVLIPEPEPEPMPQPEPEKVFRYYDHIPFEYELQELVWMACEETGCPYELALSVIFDETRYQNINGDNGNSIGYMQIQPRWNYDRMERLGVTDLSDPLSNFRVGCDLLSELIEKYDSVETALTCYNTGSPGKSRYADKVLAYMNETFFTEEAENG